MPFFTRTTKTNRIPSRMAKPLFSCTFWRCFTLSTTPRRLVAGGIFTMLLLAFALLHTGEFLQESVTCGALLCGLCIAACLIMGALTSLRFGMTERAAGITSTIMMALLPIVAMTMVECLNGVFTWNWSPQTLLLNYILYYLFYGFVYVCSGSYRLSMLLVNPLFFLLGLTNHYVCAFRGTPFVPMDLFSAGTAANVATAYDFSFNYQIVIAVLLLAFLQIAGYKLHTPRMDTVLRVASRVFFGTLIAAICILYFFTDQYADVGLKPDFWNQNRGYRRTGVVMNFCLNTKYLYVTKPDGYDAEQVETFVSNRLGDENSSISQRPSTPDDTVTPHIICIMNESLADLQVLGDLQTNVDYMPFLRNLTENTVKGNLHVPVIGSGTSNTEFEFLTGASTSFFPAGSNAYMLYVKNPLLSLVSTLTQQNYSATAFHPYYASGWNRIAVYNHFGFERFLSLGSVISNDILIRYQQSGYSQALLQDLVNEAYPGQNVMLRQYVSDSCNYDKVISLYENRDRNKPFFLFNVTMQNHGGYGETFDNFQEDVYVTAINGAKTTKTGEHVSVAYPKTNQFLSLIKRSDAAFGDLVNYFETQDEPTIICLFGDHQPSIETTFVEQLMGVNSLYSMPAEQEQARYITPFYIWANYDIAEAEIERLSVNYLSSLLLQTAQVELPAYNRYLLQLSKTLPVIHSVGHMDAEGNYYTSNSTSPYTALLSEYEQVVYNYIFDEKNRKSTLFSLGD